MDTASWLRANCRFAKEIEQGSPHLTIEDLETGQKRSFDAGTECMTEANPCQPANWTETPEEWVAYSEFVRKFYKTDDWGFITQHLMNDVEVPVWIDGSPKVVCRDADGIYRECQF